MRYWLDWGEGGKCFLKGIESQPYDTTQINHTEDLIALFPGADNDSVAQFLCEKFVPWYYQLFAQPVKTDSDPELGSLWEFKEERLIRLGDIICAFLSSTIPIVSIFLLYYIQSMFIRLVVVAVMSFLFSFIMAVILRGRRVEVFAASTAFAALQAVFIGGVTVTLQQ